MADFPPRPLYFRGKDPRYPLGGPREPIWTLRRRDKYLVPDWSGTADRTASSLVTVQTALPRLTLIDLCNVLMSMKDGISRSHWPIH